MENQEKNVILSTIPIFGDSCGCVQSLEHINEKLRALGSERWNMETTLTRVSMFSGSMAGVGDETEVLDVVIATDLVQHDFGQVTNDGFEWSDFYGGEEGHYSCDQDLVSLACECAASVVGEDHVFKGTIATGDQFIASEEYVKKLQKDFDALACEMEGASIAAVCTQYEKPFVVIRAMSDKADGNAPESIENMGDIAADNSSRIVIQMLSEM